MRHLLILVVAILLSGCIGTKGMAVRPNDAPADARYWYSVDTSGGMTPEGLVVLKARLDERFAAVRAPDRTPGAVEVRITVTSYRMRHGAARALVGIMAGTDHVHSPVELIDTASGAVLGALNVESKNQTAIGSAGGLIRGHADEIADYVLRSGS